jgi:FkbM family methyltransferase
MKIAFVKFGGLSSGGTERWLQYMAFGLADLGHEVDYYYCDSAPYLGSPYKHPDTDSSRKEYLENSKVKLMRFSVGMKNIQTPNHEWIDTDFWDIFDQSKYDFVQTAKAGPAEYPFTEMNLPVVELVTLDAGHDTSKNICWSILVSQMQRARWVQSGGEMTRSNVIPVPVFPPTTSDDLRDRLGIPKNHVVAGFHQAPRDEIFSDIPLKAFASIYQPTRHFIILSGSHLYRAQAGDLKLKNVHFLDFAADQDQLSLFLNTLDFFAHGRSDGETFGTVFAEAMIHGKACISHLSAKGSNGHIETIGPAGYVQKGLTGYIQKLEELYENVALRNSLGEIAISHSTEYYSYESALQDLVSTYQEIFQGKAKKVSSRRTEYAYSHLGYLQAGPLDDSSSIANHMLVGGTPEDFDLQIAMFFASRSSTFVDIGANIGLYCLKAAANFSKLNVYAFEPQTDAVNLLSKTKQLNKWGSNFKIYPIALSDSEGEAKIHLAGSGSTLDIEFLGYSPGTKSAVVIKRELDSYVNEIEFQNAFIKIDVEGHEISVLKGSQLILRQYQPIFFVEIAKNIGERNYINPNFEDTLVLFQQNGYRCLVSNGNKSLKKYNRRKIADGVLMYLFIPKKQTLQITSLLYLKLFKNRVFRLSKRGFRKCARVTERVELGIKRRLRNLF